MKNLLHRCARCAFPIILLGISSSLSANPALWQDLKMVDLSDKNIKQQRSIDTKNLFASSELIKYRLLTLSENDFLELLESSGDIQLLERAGARTSQAVEDELAMEISLPRPTGGFIKVKVVKNQLLSDEIAANHPDIHTYSIIPETGVTTGGSVTFTSLGVNAAIETVDSGMIYIEAKGEGQSRQYISYGRKDNSKLFHKAKENFQCKLENRAISESNSIVKNLTKRLTGIGNFNKAPTQTLPYLYGNALFYWKTPAIDQKFQHNLYKIFNDNHRYSDSEQLKLSFPYFNSLVQALSKRNPEKDAKAFLAKKQRFLLAKAQGGKISLINRANLENNYHASHDAAKRCVRSGIKYLQGMTRTQRACYSIRGSSTCTQLSRIVEKYIYRWNKVMLKDCKKH